MSTDPTLAVYGLKHNPFTQNIPLEALWKPNAAEAFFFRVESVVLDGGFILLTGAPGLGKSKLMHLLSDRLLRLGGDVVVGEMEYPPSTVSDFYRELGDLFGVNLTPSNRYRSFKDLRTRWREHINATLFRPVLLVDEAQEMVSRSLTELRLLCSTRFDSDCLMTTILCGDEQLLDKLREKALLPLESRIRTRLHLCPWDKNTLKCFLQHALESAGAPHLLTGGLQATLVEHAGGNLRALCTTADTLLRQGAQRKLKILDEKLYLEMYGQPDKAPRRSGRRTR